VYIDKSGDTELDHDVEVVGWGEEADGMKYWLVSNTAFQTSMNYFAVCLGFDEGTAAEAMC
jgi:hypothetical protein